jgi:hypothetical protein
MSQGRQLISLLKRRQFTYMEMLLLGISVCPWKRVKEALKDDESVMVGKKWIGGKEYATTWRVVKATRYTA